MFCWNPPQNLQTGPSQIGHQIPQIRAPIVCFLGGLNWFAPGQETLPDRNGTAGILECAEQAGVDKAFEISNLHCQPSGQPWVETCPGMDLGLGKNRKTKKHLGLANAHVLRADMVMYIARKDTYIIMSMSLLHRKRARWRTPDAAIHSAPCAST